MFAYTVRCEFDDPAVADEWTRWARDGHLSDVLEAGARSVELIRLDGTPIVLEARFAFSDRAAFERYERDHAPRLREEGLRLFPVTRGVRYARSTGDIVHRLAT